MKNLNFFLSKEDQDRIVDNSISIEDVKEDGSNLPDDIYREEGVWAHQSLMIKFKVKDPNNGAPKLVPFFKKGRFHTIPSDGSNSPIKVALAYDFTMDFKLDEDIEFFNLVNSLDSNIKVFPNKVWYYPLDISLDYLENISSSLFSDVSYKFLKDNNFDVTSYYQSNRTFFEDSFLSGNLDITTSGNKSFEDLEWLPQLVMAGDGSITIVITMAQHRPPQDTKISFDTYHNTSENITSDSIKYAGNALIPPRYVFNTYRGLINYTENNCKVFQALKNSDPYFFLQFTRTAEKITNFSFFFPGQTIEIVPKNSSSNILPWRGRIPAHGLIFLYKKSLITSNTTNNTITISTPSHTSPSLEMSMLKGSADCWKRPGKTDEDIDIDLSRGDEYVVLRLRMRDAVFLSEENAKNKVPGENMECKKENFVTQQSDGYSACTYFSLRRVVRALVDNRIAGGRLNNKLNSTDNLTSVLIKDVLGTKPKDYLINNGPLASPYFKKPVEKNNLKLYSIMTALFPEQENGKKKGEKAYYIWQSSINKMCKKSNNNEGLDLKDNRGDGAAGAMVYLGLAKYVIYPGTSYNYNEIASEVTAKKDYEKGALIQFWTDGRTYKDIRNGRSQKQIEDKGYSLTGHSMIMYENNKVTKNSVTNNLFYAVDHRNCVAIKYSEKESNTTLLKYRVNDFDPIEIWIIAEWTE